MGTYFSQDKGITLLDIFPSDVPSDHKDNNATLFIEHLYVIARNWIESPLKFNKKGTCISVSFVITFL